MARGTWTWIGLGVAAVTVAAAAWTLLAEEAPGGGPQGVEVVGRRASDEPAADAPLVAPEREQPRARPREREAAAPEAVPLAGPASEWPWLKGVVLDAADAAAVERYTYWIVPHTGDDPLARLDTVPGHRHTGPGGVFRERCRPGRYDVVVEAPGYERLVRSDLAVPMPTRDGYGFRLETGAGIAGTVYTEQGMPAPDVPVFLHVGELLPGGDVPRDAMTNTGRDGSFRFSPLDRGRYELSLLEPDNQRDRLAAVYVEDHVTKVDMVLATRHQVTLRLRDEAGRPVAGAHVELIGGGRAADAVSTDGGLVVLEHVADGTYSLRVDRRGFEPHAEELVLDGGYGQTMRWIGLSRSEPR